MPSLFVLILFPVNSLLADGIMAMNRCRAFPVNLIAARYPGADDGQPFASVNAYATTREKSAETPFRDASAGRLHVKPATLRNPPTEIREQLRQVYPYSARRLIIGLVPTARTAGDSAAASAIRSNPAAAAK